MVKRIALSLVLLCCLAMTASGTTSSAEEKESGTKAAPQAGNQWNQFRGPNGDGKSSATNLPVEFSETKNVRWKTPIHDQGWSSPVVWGNQIWLTTSRLEGWVTQGYGKPQKKSRQKKSETKAVKLSRAERRELILEIEEIFGMSDEDIKGWASKAEDMTDEELLNTRRSLAEGKAKPGKRKTAASAKEEATAKPEKAGGNTLALFAVCVDLQTGNIVHDIKVFDVAEPQVGNPGLNTHATPTPVVEEGRVYVHYGTYGTACLDTKTGKKLWERRDLNCDHRVRAGSSPVVDDVAIYLHFDGVDTQFVAALDKKTGKTRWLKDREVDSDLGDVMRAQGFSEGDIEETKKAKPNDNRKSYATPTIIEHQGKRQLISPGAEVTFSYDPNTGSELWRVRHPGMGWNVSCRPVFANGLIYSTTGISRHMMAVRPSGIGDVTESHSKWSMKGKDTPQIPSPLIVGDLMFMVTDEGFASCWELKSGSRLWRKRLRGGGTHWASPVYADGKLYFAGQKGVITILAASREFRLLAENKFDGSFTASPAVVEDGLILRSLTDLYYIAQPAQGK